jgi:hypothetical protein
VLAELGAVGAVELEAVSLGLGHAVPVGEELEDDPGGHDVVDDEGDVGVVELAVGLGDTDVRLPVGDGVLVGDPLGWPLLEPPVPWPGAGDGAPPGFPGSTGGSGGFCAGGPLSGSGEVGNTGTVMPTPLA